MDNELTRKSLLETYRSYCNILHGHGVSHDIISDEELQKLSLPDLNDLVRRVRDLARTPTS